jgi:hypothetical protein
MSLKTTCGNLLVTYGPAMPSAFPRPSMSQNPSSQQIFLLPIATTGSRVGGGSTSAVVVGATVVVRVVVATVRVRICSKKNNTSV